MSQLREKTDASVRDSRESSIAFGGDVARFCLQHDLSEEISKAVALANSTFAGISGLTAELEIDPETDEERVVLHLTVSAPIDDVVKSRRAFTKKWVDSAAPDVRQKIVLLYHIAE